MQKPIVAAGLIIALAACGGSSNSDPTATASDGAAAGVASGVPAGAPAPAAGVPAVAAPAASRVRAVQVAAGLDGPWALQFLPDGRMLVTERRGNLRVVTADGTVGPPLAGVPPVRYEGQGGLLDLALGPDFARDHQVFFTFAATAADGGMQTAVARATLEEGGLANVRILFRQQPSSATDIHFGSRIVFAADGTMWVGLGDRNDNQIVQSLGNHYGKIIRLNLDGSIPADNPFIATPGALPEIWSTGHRNIQGAVREPASGKLWINEHGPRGGDEINLVSAGRNYGWPRITYGRDYVTGEPVGVGTEAPGIEPPRHYWVPTSVAPAGLAFYTGTAVPGWRGNLFLGTLQGQVLIRLTLDGERVVAEERLLAELQERIRDVRMGPDGNLYLLVESSGRILRVVVD